MFGARLLARFQGPCRIEMSAGLLTVVTWNECKECLYGDWYG